MKHQWKLYGEAGEWACCKLCGEDRNGNNRDDECSSGELAFPLVVTKTKEEAMTVARFWIEINKQDYCNN